MPKQKIIFLIKFIFAVLLLTGLLIPINPIAPLGRILNPYSGIWRQTHSDFENLPPEMKLKLKKDVRVEFESTGIPHIFADDDSDLYFVEGYLEARDRLWPMDFLSRVAGGRLSEVFGKKTLSVDETFVQLRIPEAAEASLKILMKNEKSREAVESFSAGVNDYIAHLSPDELPVEFKIFNYQPEAWSPYKIALLEKFMSFNLSGYSRDLPMTRNQQILGPEDFAELFPENYQYDESIISKDHKWNFKIQLPERPRDKFLAKLLSQKLKVEPNPANGSNNWAVFGAKSSTGFPIVSNDIHLDLGLPSIWYQVQLVSKTQNVYGVSLAGAPGVVIGFSKKLAWAVTNASGDFMDWYELKYRDSSRREYLFDGAYRRVEEHDHIILVRGAAPVHERLRSTHFGPIVFDDDKAPDLRMVPHGLALRWTVLEPSNELQNMLDLNHGQKVKDCDLALADFNSPSQNFICADSDKEVKMGVRGYYPLRYKGQGRVVNDGSDSTEQWGRRLTPEELPYEVNPPRNFVFSANQKPTADNYPADLGVHYESGFRAKRIHQLLSEKEQFSPQDIQNMERDTLSKFAEKLAPIFVEELKKQKLSDLEQRATDELTHWDFRYEKEFIAPTIFDFLWASLEKNVWNPYFPDANNYAFPTPLITSDLIRDHRDSKWLRSKTESFGDVLHRSLSQSLAKIKMMYGDDFTQWKWRRENMVSLEHLSKFPLFKTQIASAGENYSVMATRKSHGPAWKMVVSLGPEFKAWGIYPGGQSSDQRSPHAREFLDDWSESRLRPLQYLDAPTESPFQKIIFKSGD